ncbi:ATP-grasp domain-containing protein [Alcanivorax sediminis]|uniref:ATP-grasp domain-containing protein n=1 Tax=Alcanivorax sediminis TaxID=2663008 RepID=A0A6N7LYX6_9GAMM|nr:hypothetical protein [Alcanivorax sediminis]MQX54384.1 hypothetical protein [Alcanivorax sediminis]
MKPNVYVATLPNGFFGSAGSSWKSLSATEIVEDLMCSGYAAKVISVDQIPRLDLKPDDVVFYTSSDDPDIRTYVKDHIYLASKFCKVVPSMDVLMAHENKGFQQIYREKMGFGGLEGTYFLHKDEGPKKYPFVFKTSNGAGSAGVELIKHEQDLKKVRGKFRVGLMRFLINLARKIKLTPSEYAIYSYRNKGKCLSVSQQFVPDLAGDYKVLVFANKYFVLRRGVRKNSFKASGSGMFEFPVSGDLPCEVLSFAADVYRRLDSPYASLDIAISSGVCYLIEYQATNFGPYTLVNSPGFYSMVGDKWAYTEGGSDLQKCFSEAMIDYLRKFDV